MTRSKLPDFSVDDTTVVIASGPSLVEEDTDLLKWTLGISTVAVNASFKRAPWAEIIYMGDFQAVKAYYPEVEHLRQQSRIWTCTDLAAEQFNVNLVRGVADHGLSKQPGTITMGGNSGHQALHLAVTCGAKRVILLGFDMMLGAAGEKHWHPDHPAPLIQQLCLDEWIHAMGLMARDLEAAGVEVVNCSRRTALTCFRRGDLREELARCRS